MSLNQYIEFLGSGNFLLPDVRNQQEISMKLERVRLPSDVNICFKGSTVVDGCVCIYIHIYIFIWKHSILIA